MQHDEVQAASVRAEESSIPKTFQLALEHHQAGRLPQAEALYREILQVQPNHPDALHLSGMIAYVLGKIEIAVELIGKAISASPSSAIYYSNLGNALKDQGKLDEAMTSYRKALALKPDFAEAHGNLGLALQEQGELDVAVASYQKALALRPDYAEAHYNLGNALQEQGELDLAVASYGKALALKPDYAEAHCNLGNALKDQGRLDEAIACYERALAFNPDFAQAHTNLGTMRKDQGKLAEAVACQERALALKPDFAEAHSHLGIALQDLGYLAEAVACYKRALAIKPAFAQAQSNLLFCLNYHPDLAAEEIYAEYRRWDERHAQSHRPTMARHDNNRDPERRLRIGYVSPDLCRHPVRHFIEPLLAHHDKARVEVFAYAEVAREDEFSATLKGHVEHWLRTVGMGDEELAERIRRDDIDILVDLAGHTRGHRLLVFARKPAPIQVSWLGYGYTTGLAAMDYFLADETFAPAGSEPLFAEKLVRLPLFAAYRPADGMGNPGPLPALSRGGITFGSLTRSIRINYRVVRAWSAILRAVPGSRLVVNSSNYRDMDLQRELLGQFASQGIPAERLDLGFDSPPWDVLRGLDIGLDCFPHNSGTTLYESLYLGVPFVTLAGRPSVGRLGATILSALGHPEWIAATEEDYVAKAVELAAKLDRLASLRAGLRAEMVASPLMDEEAFTRSVEAAYRTMWQRWCAGEPAASFGITAQLEVRP